MKFFVALLLLSASAFGQEGIPDDVGTGLLPAGLVGETDAVIKQSRIEALQHTVQAMEARYIEGLDDASAVIQAERELATARLDATNVMQERLDAIEEALRSAVLRWQRVKELQRGGYRGGDAASDITNRIAVYRYRIMWLQEKSSEKTQTKATDLATSEHEGIPHDVGTGILPPGLDGNATLEAIKQTQIHALQQGVHAARSRILEGLDSVNNLFEIQTQLAIARLETTSVTQERLDFIQEALGSALLAWQRTVELQRVGARGGDTATEALTRAAVFGYRVMWLKEKHSESGQSQALESPASEHEGIPQDVGTGLLPQGLIGDSSLDVIQQHRIDALQETVRGLHSRVLEGSDKINNLLDAQLDLTLARLDVANIKQERLDLIEDSLRTALFTWQRVKELQRVGARGGDQGSEGQARAAVFRYRVMWLNEKAG